LQVWAVTMINPATGWLEIKDIKTKRADVVSNVIENTWLTRYPRPSVITPTFLRLWKTEWRTTYEQYILQHTETYVRNERN